MFGHTPCKHYVKILGMYRVCPQHFTAAEHVSAPCTKTLGTPSYCLTVVYLVPVYATHKMEGCVIELSHSIPEYLAPRNTGYTPVGISENAVAPPPHSFTNHSGTICSRALIRLRNSQYGMSKVVVNWFCTGNELGAVYTTAVTTFANTTAVPSRAGGLDSSSS